MCKINWELLVVQTRHGEPALQEGLPRAGSGVASVHLLVVFHY